MGDGWGGGLGFYENGDDLRANRPEIFVFSLILKSLMSFVVVPKPKN